MNNIKLFLVLICLSFSSLSFAIDLSDAKAQGLVGETKNGYLASVKHGSSAEVEALIKDINNKRKKRYNEISAKVGKPLAVIESLAGEKFQKNTKSGNYIQQGNGRWNKK